MKIAVFSAGLFAVSALLTVAASAQQARTYKYCLEQGRGTFPLMTCYYETMEQCLASKTSPSDRCYVNPQWTGRR
jgi:Protein of unknown function (DUF3551)